MNIPMQAEVVKDLLSTESITVIGLLLGVCGLLIWHISKIENRYNALIEQHNIEEKDNKKFLIDLVTKNISAMEQIKQTINSLKDGLNSK